MGEHLSQLIIRRNFFFLSTFIYLFFIPLLLNQGNLFWGLIDNGGFDHCCGMVRKLPNLILGSHFNKIKLKNLEIFQSKSDLLYKN